MIKVFAYLRVSSPSQAKDDRDGFVRQEQACRDYAKNNQLEIVEIFREAFTGTEAHRPELARLIVSLEQNHHGVKTVLIERLDRLAREYFIQEAIIRDLKKNNFDIISTAKGEEDLCSNDPSRKLMRTIMGGIAEYDKEMLILKLKVAKERKRARGEKADGQYGYKDTEEGQAIIIKVKELYRKPKKGNRRTFKQIADTLNREGVLTLKGKKWSLHRVRDIILDR